MSKLEDFEHPGITSPEVDRVGKIYFNKRRVKYEKKIYQP